MPAIISAALPPKAIAYQWSNSGPSSGVSSNYSVVDTVSPEIMHMIDEHWYQYPPLNPLWHAILGFIIGVLGTISVVGNFMVIYIFCSTKSLRSPSNLLVVNLAFSDFLLMLTMSPTMVINCYYETWVLGPFMCELYGLLGSQFGCTSIWTMTVIAMDRYNVIVKGLSAKPLTTKRALLWLFMVWVFSGIWTIFPLFGWGRYVPEGNMTACGTDYLTKNWISKSYILCYSVFCYFAPLFAIIFCYYFIVKTVAAHEKSMREQAKKMNVASLRSADAANTSAEAKLAKVALMTITLWFIAWTPYLIINYLGIFNAYHIINPLSTIWSSVFAKANACYNPIVYAISHPKYRAALHQRFPSLACGGPEQSSSSSEADATKSVQSGATAVSAEDN